MRLSVSIVFIVTLFIHAGIPASAQQKELMLGLRQGVGMWMTKNGAGHGSLRFPPGQHFSWNKEIFIRRTVTKSWTAELGLEHYKLTNEVLQNGDSTRRERMQFLQLNLAAQYDVSYPLLGYIVPYFLKMRSFVGLSVAPRLAFIDRGSEKSRNSHVLIGVAYTHMLPVTSRLWAISSFSYRTILLNRFRDNPADFSNPNRSFMWQGGMMYELGKPKALNR